MTKLMAQGCALCNPASEAVLWRDAFCRIILADEPGYPGYCRVILERHMSEMTDLSGAERAHLMARGVRHRDGAARSARARTRSTWQAWATWSRTCTGTSFRATGRPSFPHADLGATLPERAPGATHATSLRLARALTQRLG